MKKPAKKPAPVAKQFSIRLEPEIRAALTKAGKAEDRPAAYVALRYLKNGLKESGFIE